ncbi:type IV secretory system conjugative DNA transfer family protein, partial [Salinispora oceanensis]
VTPELQKTVRQTITAKLPLGDLVESWDQVGTHAVGMWTVRERPPRTVGFADIEPYLDALKDDEFLLGLRAGGRPYVVSLNNDSPHIACSAGSGAGKSVLAMLLAVQVLSRGGRVLILDRKGSHRWALGLPGVTYCTAPADMHAAIVGTAALADERNSAALAQPEGWNPGPRVLVIFEEMNATVAQLKAHWDESREKSDPKVSPAIQGFRNIMFMGRSAKVHLFGVAQMLTANTTGGPESRENFGIRALARYTANNWKMLAPECPMPRKSGTLGRWQLVVAGTATEVQVAYLNPKEARAIAITGRPVDLENTPGVPVSPVYVHPRDDQDSLRSVSETDPTTGDTLT